MGYGSISGRALTNASKPKAHAICDRCGFRYNHSDLHFQYDYRGRTLQNTRILVCDSCMDTPQPQLKPRIVPPDPIPVRNARTEFFELYETNTRVTQGMQVDFFTGLPISNGGDTRITQNQDTRVTQQTGQAPGGRNLFPGVRFMVPGDGTNDIPYGTPGVPNSGLITEETRYSVWTNNPTNAAYFTNDAGFEMYWNQDGDPDL